MLRMTTYALFLTDTARNSDPSLDGLAVDAGVEELLAPMNGRQREVVWQRIVLWKDDRQHGVA